MPCTRVMPSARRCSASLPKAPCTSVKRGSFECRRRPRSPSGSRSSATSRPCGPEPREDEAAVTAAAEGAVDVDARRLERSGTRRLRRSSTVSCACAALITKSPRVPAAAARREAAGILQPSAPSASLFHSSNFLPCPTSTTALSECGVIAQRGGDEHAARPRPCRHPPRSRSAAAAIRGHGGRGWTAPSSFCWIGSQSGSG